MVLLISALATIGVIQPILLDSGFPWGEGGSCVHGHGFAELCSLFLCQIRALEKTLKKQNNGQYVPKIWVLNAYI